MKELTGNIHSTESCGAVDGPGIRFVVFMQGCPLRCKYCHNPDSWSVEMNTPMTVDEIMQKYEGVKEFVKGGITVTGGEPMMQAEFVTELFKTARNRNIHTALDTSGILFNPEDTSVTDELLKYTNLVLLDIKHINDEEHKKLTGSSNKNVLAFAHYLSDKNIPVWIRHVVVKGITLDEKYLRELGRFLSTLKNVNALDVLPYHNMAVPKYEALNIDYPLKNTPPTTKEEAIYARNIILEEYKKSLAQNKPNKM